MYKEKLWEMCILPALNKLHDGDDDDDDDVDDDF